MKIIKEHGSAIRNVLWWTLASLIAIVLVEYNGLLGLGAAIVGGIALGVFLSREPT